MASVFTIHHLKQFNYLSQSLCVRPSDMKCAPSKSLGARFISDGRTNRLRSAYAFQPLNPAQSDQGFVYSSIYCTAPDVSESRYHRPCSNCANAQTDLGLRSLPANATRTCYDLCNFTSRSNLKTFPSAYSVRMINTTISL